MKKRLNQKIIAIALSLLAIILIAVPAFAAKARRWKTIIVVLHAAASLPMRRNGKNTEKSVFMRLMDRRITRMVMIK